MSAPVYPTQAEWAAVRADVLADPTCAYCGGYATTVDHVIPTARGGTNDLTNLVAACWPCNTEKGARTPEEWKAARLVKGRSWPPPRYTREEHDEREARRERAMPAARAVPTLNEQESIEAFVTKHLATAPPLRPEQRDRLASLFKPTRKASA